MKAIVILFVAIFSLMTLSMAQTYEHEETQDLVSLVNQAADLIQNKGEAAFTDFRLPESKWRDEETYIFVLDPDGNMLVHPDPELEGTNQMSLVDINGKPIIRGLLNAATAIPDKHEGWYHYQWPVPGAILPRWKSSFVQLVKAPSGKGYIVGSGMYNDRMEKAFVIDAVENAAGMIEEKGKEAFRFFYDPTGPFIVKDAYIFVTDMHGVELVNPAFPNLEGRNIMDLKDTHGKYLVSEMLDLVKMTGSGWVDYMWPKPGESIPTMKSTFVSKAKLGNAWVLVGCGVYLEDAPKAVSAVDKMTAPELMDLVNDAAAVFEQRGENVFPEFRLKGSKWFRDNTYFFVWTMDGVRYFHAANPEGEGMQMRASKDVHGRPWGKMFIEAAAGKDGEGWVHYMYPEPGNIFPTWKSSFIKRVTFPSGKDYLIGCGIYNMQMDKAFIEDLVNRAVALVAEKGEMAFDQLRDKTGPFTFMDTYVFVNNPEGYELVNPLQPSLEGQKVIDMQDLKGKYAPREYINAALTKGKAWVDYYWYKPGSNTPAHKYSFVRKVEHDGKIYIVGSGYFPAEDLVR